MSRSHLDLSIIVPLYNEEESIRPLFEGTYIDRLLEEHIAGKSRP